MRHPAGDSAKARADRFHGQFEQINSKRTEQQGDNWSRDARGKTAADNQREHGECGQRGGFVRNCVEVSGQGFYAQPENSGNFFQMQSEEIFHLRTRDENRNSVGESNDHGSRNKFDRGTQAGHTHNNQQNARHHRA